MVGAYYGLFLGLAMFVMMNLIPQPAGAVIFFALVRVQLSRGALICWRRTRLPFMTATLVHGAVMSLSLVVLEASGHPFRNLAAESWVLYVAAMVTAMLLMHIESRVNQQKWKELGRHMEHQSVWNIITARHFPAIGDRGPSVP